MGRERAVHKELLYRAVQRLRLRKMGKSVILAFLALCLAFCYSAELNPSFYDHTCPHLVPTVRSVLEGAFQKEPRMAASLLRLHFHDCFVQGCDASILLDDKQGFVGEKTSNPNRNSARGFEVVDEVKAAVEAVCPGVASCADLLALIARESVVLMGGPSWTVLYGRRDSTTASRSASNNDIPPPTSTLSNLITKFQNKGLNVQELVALSGSHTIGLARCTSFKDRLYNFSNTNKPDPNLDARYASTLRYSCPRSGGDNNTSPLDYHTPTHFDHFYYLNLQYKTGLLNSDQVLTTGSAKGFASSYAYDQNMFFKDFASAIVKMGNISPLTGGSGQIRKNCRVVN